MPCSRAAFVVTLAIASAGARAQTAPASEVMLSGLDNPTGGDGLQRGGSGALPMPRNGDVVGVINLTDTQTGATERWLMKRAADGTWTPLITEGTVVGPDNLVVRDLNSELMELGASGSALLEIHSDTVVRELVLFEPPSTFTPISVSGAQCEGEQPGIVHQGGNGPGTHLVNESAGVGFRDCSGFIVGTTGSDLHYSPQTNPMPGVVGSLITSL